MAEKRLRFAALIRVSTEQQEQQGESLRTQEKQITEAVERLGGTIVRRYSGQEHATPGYERQKLAELLKDAGRKPRPFDAVMVINPSRWSRDNAKSDEHLEWLRDCGVRFFTLGQEHDLFDEGARLFLSMQAVFGGYQSRLQKRTSLESRIKRAEDGLPSCGRLPYGRRFDKPTKTWSVDLEKQREMQTIADRYLAGESLAKIAKEKGISHANLHKRLMKLCGATWEQRFDADDLNIHRVVPTPVPALLSEETIAALHQRAKRNKTYENRNAKVPYLLGAMVFCGECGYTLFGQTNPSGIRYYRHSKHGRAGACKCNPKPWVRADHLDAAVSRELFAALGNRAALQRALEAAVPKTERIASLKQEREQLEREAEKLTKKKESIIDKEVAGRLTKEEANEMLDDVTKRQSGVQSRLDQIHDELANLPDSTAIANAAERVATKFNKRKKKKKTSDRNYSRVEDVLFRQQCRNDFTAFTTDDQREVAKAVFSGKTPDGRRMGVYVYGTDRKVGRARRWKYVIHAQLVHDAAGTVPMSKRNLGLLVSFGAEEYSEIDEFGRSVISASRCRAAVPL